MALDTDLRIENINGKYDIIAKMGRLYFVEGVEKQEEECYNFNNTSLCSTKMEISLGLGEF